MATRTNLTITIDPITAAYVQENNQGNPLTEAAADTIAERYNDMLEARIWDEYGILPDKERLNGIDGFRVYGENDEQEDEVRRFLESAAQAIWQSGDLWDIVSGCAYCSSDVCHAEGEPVPAVDDDEAWSALTVEHTEDCEWITTRAHQVEQA